MTVREAWATDARLIQTLTADLFEATGTEAPRISLARIRDRIQWPHIVTAIDPVAGTYLDVLADEQQREFEIYSWLPRGRPLAELMPVMDFAMRALARRWPQGMDWKVWGEYHRAVDALGRRDGGRVEAQVLRRKLLDSGGRRLIEVDTTGGGNVPYSTLRKMLRIDQRRL